MATHKTSESCGTFGVKTSYVVPTIAALLLEVVSFSAAET